MSLKGLTVDIKKAAKKIEDLSKQYGLNVDPYAKIEDISLGVNTAVGSSNIKTLAFL